MSMAIDRLPPQNIEAEQAVLGAMLIERDAILRALEFIRGDDFYRETHLKIFDTIVFLFERSEAVDIVTVTEELRRRGHLEEVGGIAYVTSLANLVPTAANVEHYARIVETKAALRRLIQVSGEVARQAFEGQEEIEDILDHAEKLIFAVSQRRRVRGYVPLRQVLMETYERLEHLYAHQGQITGVPSGFEELDRLTSGFQPSDLAILAARPAQGKTALSLNIACNVALRKKIAVGVFSLEMSREQVAMRILCAVANISAQRIRNGTLTDEEWRKLTGALARLSEAPILIDDTPNISLMELRAKARRMKAEHGIGLLIVDYLQLIQGRSRAENRQQEISEISRSLKALAREIQVPVIALSQLSRAVEQRENKKPMLSDLRESGSLEQDADLVAFIYHNPEAGPDSNVVELIVAKHRNGPTGSVNLCFLKESGLFARLEKRFQPA